MFDRALYSNRALSNNIEPFARIIFTFAVVSRKTDLLLELQFVRLSVGYSNFCFSDLFINNWMYLVMNYE